MITNPLSGAVLSNRDHLVNDGPVEFPCTASGTPDPAITWYHNGAIIQSGNGVVVSNDGSLTILALQVTHSGVYQCVATNKFGVDRRTWVLEVREERSMFNIIV